MQTSRWHVSTTALGILMAAMILLAGGTFCGARVWHVTPDGRADGDGSIEKPLDVFTALSATSPAKGGDVIQLAGGTYDGRMDGIKRVPFELAVSGEEGNPVRIMPAPGQSAHLNGSADLTSSHAEIVGLDIGDLKWDPTQEKHKTETAVNARGGSGTKLINCNIFGGAMGTGGWSPAVDLVIYGCLVHDFGYTSGSGGRGHGHAFYTQNERGTKVIEHSVAYRGYGWNLHIYTQSGEIKGFDVLENIFYIAGAARPGQTMDNYLVAGYPPADNIRLIGNVGYQPVDVEAWRPNARLGNFRPALNGTGEVRDNMFMGAFYGLSLGNWRKLTMTGNTIWATGVLIEISTAPTGSGIGKQDAKPDLAGYTVDRNTYVANGQAAPFYYGNREQLDDDKRAELLSFDGWQALGLDRNGTLLAGRDGRPIGTKALVFPNRHEKGRANVAVFNWDGHAMVEVDLIAVLAPGQSYRIYNCLDIKQTIALAEPILRGTYDGKPVSLPMRKDPISPDFDAFLILPVAAD